LDKLFPPAPTPPADAKKPETKTAANAPAGAPGQPGAPGSAGAPPAQPPTDVDAMLEPVRTNEMLRGMVAKVIVRIKAFNGFKIKMQNINMDFSFKDLVAAIEKFELGVFKGTVKSALSLDLKPKHPTYKLSLNVDGLDMQDAVQSQMESLKNTVIGILSLKAAGNGASFNSDLLLKNLVLNGDFKIAEAKFATVDVAQMVTEGLNGSIAKIGDKVPTLKDKKIKQSPDKASKYKQIGSSFSLVGGKLKAPNFVTESYPKKGVDVKGNTEIDLIGDTLDATWFVVDTYNVTGAFDISVDVQGIHVDHVLAKKGVDPVSFPVIVGCKLSAPCYKYNAIPEYLGAIAWENVSGKVRGKAEAMIKEQTDKFKAQANAKIKEEQDKAKKQAEDKAKEEAKKQGGDKAKDALKNIKKPW